MAGQRSAGYCSGCNRGVTIVLAKKSVLDKMRSALNQADNDANWVCTKCGQPATRGYTPPPAEATEVTESMPLTPDNTTEVKGSEADDVKPDQPDQEQPATRKCPACDKLNLQEAQECSFCQKTFPEPTSNFEATCHLCDKPLPFDKEAAGTQINCPTCNASVRLPETDSDSSALTSPPIVVKLEDDPDRPEISKALCTQCNFEMTYPKRLAGKNVGCPSCSTNFPLP